jgi:hypothetical protein
MKRRIVIGASLILVIAIAFFLGIFYQSTVTTQPVPSSESSLTTGNIDAEQSQTSAGAIPTMPTASGDSYYALDLLIKRPFPDQGQLITLDVAASPSVVDGRVLSYQTYPGHIPNEAYARGINFKQMLGNDICIYDVIEQVPGDGRTIPDSAGQIAVEIGPNIVCPSSERIWDAEPKDVEEVTLNDGTIKQLPKVRFWRYHAG